MRHLLLSLIFSVLVSGVIGIVGPIACIAACELAVIACYAAGGLVFGAVTLGPGAPAAAVACSAGQSVCVKACAASAVTSCGMCLVM